MKTSIDERQLISSSRLPVKSIATIRCVSKPMSSRLLRPDFTELFLTRSSACSPAKKKDIVADAELSFVGVTRTGEIVLSPYGLSNGVYLIYYNLDRNTFTKVEIQGMDASLYYDVPTFLDHVEDVKL